VRSPEAREGLRSNEAKGERHFYLAVVGPTGAGKTTLVELLAKELGIQKFLEKPTYNPWLNLFYASPPESCRVFGPLSQRHYQREAIDQAREIGGLLRKGSGIQDVSPQGHLMYPFLQYQQGLMSDFDFQRYMGKYKDYENDNGIPKPDLLIILRISPGELIKRIKERTSLNPEERASELNMDTDYWVRQTEYWEKWIQDPPPGQNFLVLDAGNNDWTENGTDGRRVVDLVKQKLRALGFPS